MPNPAPLPPINTLDEGWVYEVGYIMASIPLKCDDYFSI
jgi:hypothetical protein